MDQLFCIRVFVRVVEQGSFARAADDLAASRSSVTTAVGQLERRLGVRLLHRTTRRLSLTDEGRAYYERCVRILEDLNEAEEALYGTRALPKGRLKVSVPQSFTHLLGINKRRTGMQSDEDAPEEMLTPPDAARVASRALVLSIVTCRGFVEKDSSNAGSFWTRSLAWFRGLSLDPEVEPWEVQLLGVPLGELDTQTQVNAQWLCEGLVVLAWALNQYAMPAYDVQVDPADVANSLGFLEPKSSTVLNGPQLRPVADLLAARESIFSVHWRLREHSLRPDRMDFGDFAERASFGPLSLDGIRLIDGDLAVGELPIFRADAEKVRVLTSITQERHRAANWLLGESLVYSETETNT